MVNDGPEPDVVPTRSLPDTEVERLLLKYAETVRRDRAQIDQSEAPEVDLTVVVLYVRDQLPPRERSVVDRLFLLFDVWRDAIDAERRRVVYESN